MKIKEVMEQTGLTDRAIRLYISNGLIDPQCERSYTGRNNYDFSNEDIELLRKIALLRKADFSLEQIRDLQTGGEEAVTAFNTYLTALRKEHERNEKVLHALQDFPAQVPTIEEVCRRLERSFQAEPTPKAVHDERPPHFHTPSSETRWFRIWIDTICHLRTWTDSRSATAHCHQCGALITYPKVVWRYYRIASILQPALTVGGVRIVTHYLTERIIPVLIIMFCALSIIYFFVPMLLFSVCSWEVIPVRVYSEEEAIERQVDEAKEWLRSVFRWLILGVVLMLMTEMFFAKRFGW